MRKTNMIKNKLGTAIFCVLVLVLWQILAWIGVACDWWKSYAFPEPLGVCESLVELVQSGMLLRAVLASLWRAVRGFGLALFIGGVLGILISFFSYFERHLKPLLLGIQSLPSICWVPFAILWFGLEESAVIFVVVMGCMFSVALTLEHAIKEVPYIYIKAATNMGANRGMMLRKVIFPAALPNIVAGLKQSWSFAWRALMSGEVMSSYIGLGYALMVGRDMADINQVMAVMLVIILLGIVIERYVFGRIEKYISYKV